MVELWYGILAFMMTTYVMLDGRNFGVGVLHLLVARTQAERRQVIAAIGPLWSWHEVWLVSTGGVMFVAFPHLLAVAFSGYYLALFLVLWCLILRGIALEVGGHLDDRMWQGFWDFVFAFANILLAILFGAALGNMARGVPLDATGEFHMAFFTDFSVRGYVGLLDWYTVSMGVVCLAMVTAHGATYLTLKTDGPVHDRCALISRWLWSVMPVFFILISIETLYVRPHLLDGMIYKPVALLGVLILGGSARAPVIADCPMAPERRAFIGSCLIIVGLLGAGASAIFPVILYSTLDPHNSLTIYNTAASTKSLELAIIWWPVAFVLSMCLLRLHY